MAATTLVPCRSKLVIRSASSLEPSSMTSSPSRTANGSLPTCCSATLAAWRGAGGGFWRLDAGDQVGQQLGALVDDVVAQQDGERLVADVLLGHADGVAEAERGL